MFVSSRTGCRLHVQVDGVAGTAAAGSQIGNLPLVCAHSLGTNLTLWDAQLPRLAQDRPVWRYDTRGHGESQTPAGEYTLEQLGRDLLSIADAASGGPVDLCGISIGGQTALWAALHAPQRVRRLIVANTAARIGDVALWTERIRIASTEGLAPVADTSMERWFTEQHRAREPALVERFRSMLARTSVGGYVGCSAALRDADLRSLVEAVQCPTLIIAGRHDVSTPPEASRWLADAIEGARYVELDCAHLSNVECADAFSDAVHEFLRATP